MKKIILSLCVMVTSGAMTQIINTFPYNQNFEGEGASTACNGYTMLSPGWSNDNLDVNDWVPDAGGTTSTGTGPSVDYNPGTLTGKYMYTETSGCSNDTRNLQSTWFDFTATTGLEMSFAYHMFGATQGTMAVDYRTGLANPWTSLVAPFTDNQDLWQISTSDISFLSGNDSVQFRIVAATGTSFTSDMAIDDFSVIETTFDATISVLSNETCFGDANGSMVVSASYGVAPFTYAWDSGANTDTITGLIPGTYCCLVTDNIGQSVIVCADIIGAAGPLQATVHAVDPWVCTDSLGTLVIDDISGGVIITPSTDCGISLFTCSPDDTLTTADVITATVNTTTGYPCPLGNFYWGNREQMLYRASELNAIGVQPGNIYGIAFYVQSTGTSNLTLNNWTIKMGCTPANNTLAWNDTACVQVLAPANHNIVVGWNWFTFDSPYYWNGTDNLLLETCFNNSSFTQNVIQELTVPDPGNASTIYYRADNATVCGASTITGTSTQRALTLFSNCFIDNSPSFNYVYSWDTGSANDSTIVPAGTYTLTVSDSLGCTIQEMLTVNESAPVNIDDLTICENNPNAYAATPGFNSYEWSNGESTQSITITTGGIYYVDATDSLGCKTSDTAMVTAIPSPVLAASPSPETFGGDGAIYLSIYSSAFPFQVDWDTDGIGDNDDTENQFYLSSGDYTVTVTDANGCYTTLTVTVGNQVGLNENGVAMFTAYPNPTSGLLTVQLIAPVKAYAVGQITDVQGRLVESISFNGSNLIEIDLSGNEPGIYFVNVLIDGQQTVAKILLQ